MSCPLLAIKKNAGLQHFPNLEVLKKGFFNILSSKIHIFGKDLEQHLKSVVPLKGCFSVFNHYISLRVLSKQHLFILFLRQRFVSTHHSSADVTLIFERTPGVQTSVCDHPEPFRVLSEQSGQTVLIEFSASLLRHSPFERRAYRFCPLDLEGRALFFCSLFPQLTCLFPRWSGFWLCPLMIWNRSEMRERWVFAWGIIRRWRAVFLLINHTRRMKMFKRFLSWGLSFCIYQFSKDLLLILQTV